MRYAETGFNLEVDLSRGGTLKRSRPIPGRPNFIWADSEPMPRLSGIGFPPEVGPFSPENLLIFGAGLLCGTPATGCN